MMCVILDAIARKLTNAPGCHSKIQYETERCAKISAREMHGKTGANFDHYHCPACGFWHIGTRRGPGKHAARWREAHGEVN